MSSQEFSFKYRTCMECDASLAGLYPDDHRRFTEELPVQVKLVALVVHHKDGTDKDAWLAKLFPGGAFECPACGATSMVHEPSMN